MHVNKAMTADVIACSAETNLASVAQVMWDRDCGLVPVIDAAGRLLGVVTDRDICIASATRRLLPEQMRADEVMVKAIHTCGPDDAMEHALATMKEFRVRRLPVVADDGKLKGILSTNDIVRVSEAQKRPASEDIVSAMAAIGAHRPVVRTAA